MTTTTPPTPAADRRSRTVRGLFALGVAGALLAGLAACGGDDGGDSDSATATSAAAAAAAAGRTRELPVAPGDGQGRQRA